VMERPWTARDCFQLRRDEGGQLLVRRVRSQARDVPLIAVGGVSAFETGPEAGAGGRALAVSVLADLLEASADAAEYENAVGVEGMIWDVHRSCYARWFQALRVQREGWREVDVRELHAWVRAEFRARFHVE
jgi:hypothetical protein